MKILCKDPLFYKEWKVGKWMAILMTCSLFFCKTRSLISSLNRDKYLLKTDPEFIFNKYWFNVQLMRSYGSCAMLILVLVLLFSILLFKGEKQDSTYSLMASMPFKRKDIIVTKFKVGVLSIFIPYFINFIITTIFYFSNTQYIFTTYYDVPAWFLINFLFTIFFFSFIVLIHTMIGQYFVATITAPIILIVPYGLACYLLDVIRMQLNISFNNPNYVKINNIINHMNVYSVPEADYTWLGGNRSIFVYSNYGKKVIILVALITAVFILAVTIYNKVKLENINSILIFKSLEPIFKWGVAICFGVLISTINSNAIQYEQSTKSSLLIIYILLFIGTLIGYFITNKILKVYNK
ncbi:ABC transporter permease [Clostridium niameyense]|uniref:ABC transporter permease n=1 Tax=Clostridium niameyense TaxID=1622073 RepID=A0A6M0R6K8_9CLOT|nr:ABC transporter permease subunit [Clostridium niameyense]NEZ45805.1 ABC transporter permease [Clostridium niameyense]